MLSIYPNLTFAQKKRPKPEIPSERFSDFAGNPDTVQKVRKLLGGNPARPQTDTLEFDTSALGRKGKPTQRERIPETIELNSDGSCKFDPHTYRALALDNGLFALISKSDLDRWTRVEKDITPQHAASQIVFTNLGDWLQSEEIEDGVFFEQHEQK
jgi:hypothetical protein